MAPRLDVPADTLEEWTQKDHSLRCQGSSASACVFQVQGQPHAPDEHREEHLTSPAPTEEAANNLNAAQTSCRAKWLPVAWCTHMRGAMRMLANSNSDP